MRIKDGFVLRQVAGQGMVIAAGEASKDFHGMVKLNRTGSLIWQGIAEGKTPEQMAECFMEMYEVEKEKALDDINKMIGKMKDAGFIVEE